MLVGGIFEIVHAFGVKTWGRFVWWLGSGILYAAAGIVAFMNPILASSVLTCCSRSRCWRPGLIRIWVGFEQQAQRELGLDRRGRRRHRARRADHRARLAGQQPVHPRHLPGVRPDLPGRDADRVRLRAQALKASLELEVELVGRRHAEHVLVGRAALLDQAGIWRPARSAAHIRQRRWSSAFPWSSSRSRRRRRPTACRCPANRGSSPDAADSAAVTP